MRHKATFYDFLYDAWPNFIDTEFMIIPPERLAKQTLDNLLEEFITRDGTDYGVEELSLENKLLQLKGKLDSGKAVIWFDSASESTQIMTQEEHQQMLTQQSGHSAGDFPS